MLRKPRGMEKGEKEVASFEGWVKFGQPENRRKGDVPLGDKLEQKLRAGRLFYLGTVGGGVFPNNNSLALGPWLET